MDLPQKTLEKLKCSECANYLSCGPVFIKHEDGEAICGRCHKPGKEKVTQIKQYEAVAEHLRFPCKYSEFGCQEKVQFSLENLNQHEQICNYRNRVCPIGKIDECDWRGAWDQLKQHCKDKHPQQIFENFCFILHDISKPKMINYLLVAFNFLFVLHTKICNTSGRILHTVRLLGKKEEFEDFEFILDIRRDKEHIIKYGKVISEDNIENEEHTALALNIKNLEEILGGINDAIFNITLKNTQAVLFGDNKIKCKHCKKDFIPNGYSFEFISVMDNSNKNYLRLCDSCKLIIKFCKNKEKGCTYYDIEAKCKKHEKYFCSFISQCTGDEFTNYSHCLIEQGTLFKHLKSYHRTECTEMNTPKYYGRNSVRFLLSSIIGTIVVEAFSNKELNMNSNFKIYTALKARKLDMYCCQVTMTTPNHQNIEVSTENIKAEDWSFTIVGQNHCKFAINIIRKEFLQIYK